MKNLKIGAGLWLTLLLFANCNSSAQETNLSVTEFDKSVSGQSVQLLDVRTAGEFAGAHLANAMQADWTNLEEFERRAAALDKTKPVYTYCLSGGRSNAATKWLNDNGYKAYNLAGGITRWNNEGKPVVQEDTGLQLSMDDYLKMIPATGTVLVDFGASWCPPCKKMDPITAALEKQYGNQFTLLKIDAGTNTNLLQQMNIATLPGFIIYKNGKPVWQRQGLVEKAELQQQLSL